MIRVIIADDEKLICRLVQALADWDSLGMEVAGTAENGLEALQLVEALEPDILITDIRMPGCDGLELIRRAKELRPQLEVVIISGYAHFEYAQSAIQFGVGNYLLKPIKKEELMDTLRKMKERCEARFDKEEGMAQRHQNSQHKSQFLHGEFLLYQMQILSAVKRQTSSIIHACARDTSRPPHLLPFCNFIPLFSLFRLSLSNFL